MTGTPRTTVAWSQWPPWRRLRTLLPLAALDFSIVESLPDHHRGFGWLAIVLLVVATLGWLAMGIASRPRWATILSPTLMSAAGIALSVIANPGLSIVYPAVACLSASTRTPPRRSLPFTLAVAGTLTIAQVAAHHGVQLILLGPSVCVAGMLVGLIRLQNEALAEETRLAREGQARSAALDERARIAREIHDVLAHSLAALTVQLETADALLETNRTQQARTSITRANQLAREGLAETRRAIDALRGHTLPLPTLLTTLTTNYHTDHHAPATTHIHGTPRDLNPDTTLTLYRTAQEAMTNIRKHAPGATVHTTLHYQPTTITLTIHNTPPPPGTPTPLATTGGGHGLTGLRERAELAGGTLTAGPTPTTETHGPDGAGEPGWCVRVRIPA